MYKLKAFLIIFFSCAVVSMACANPFTMYVEGYNKDSYCHCDGVKDMQVKINTDRVIATPKQTTPDAEGKMYFEIPEKYLNQKVFLYLPDCDAFYGKETWAEDKGKLTYTCGQ